MEEKDLQDYIAAFKRRIKTVGVIAGAIVVTSLLLAFLLPPTYRSSATILIEEQEIPTEMVRSTITTFAAQRLQTINQRVMTRANLEKIIEKFDLYADKRKRNPMEEIIDKMREDLSFEPISAEVIDPRTGQPSKATIAFALSYDGRNPGLVQRVANEVTSLYLEENLKSRTQKTAETSGFLQEEAKRLGDFVAEMEGKLAEFKEAHLHSLPEYKEMNLQFMDRTERELMDINDQVRTLEERKVFLDAELAQIKPESDMYSSTGQRIMSPADRLKILQTEYLALSSKYSEKHPDVVKARQELEAMRKEVGSGENSGIDQVKELGDLRSQLTAALQKYSEGHPDVVKLKKQITSLEDSINRLSTLKAAKEVAAKEADNPAYISLMTQRKTVDQDVAALAKKRVELRVKLEDYEKRLGATPDIERQYLELVRDYDNASMKFRELKAKELEAKIAEELEKKSKGERFSIIEPPMLPEKPIKPNRTAIAALGFILAIAAGVGYVLLLETLDKTVRGSRVVIALTGVAPIATIPLLIDQDQMAEKVSRRTLIFMASLIGAGVLLLLLIHFFVSPLDVLWFRALRKLEG
jgi:uncharacterized protein involved in exopolysaccharide biosynthesis